MLGFAPWDFLGICDFRFGISPSFNPAELHQLLSHDGLAEIPELSDK